MNLEVSEDVYVALTKIFVENPSVDLTTDIAFTTGYPAVNTSEWVWGLEEREDGMSYDLESEESIMGFGLASLLIKYPTVFPYVTNHFLTTSLDWIKSNPEKFLNVVPGISTEVLEQRISIIDNSINVLQEQEEIARLQRISETQTDEILVERFKGLMATQWKEGRNLYELFKFKKSLEQNPDEELKQIGTQRMKLKEGKAMFIQGEDFRNVYGIDWGKHVNREIERYFIHTIGSSIPNFKELESITGAFDEVIKDKSIKENSEWFAFIPSRLSYQWQVTLVNSGNYNTLDGNSPYPFQALGIFKDRITVIRLSQDFRRPNLIIAKIPDSIVYRQRVKEEFEDGQLQVSVVLNDYNNGEVENQDGDQNSIGADAKILVQEIMDFKIKNSSNILVYDIKTTFN